MSKFVANKQGCQLHTTWLGWGMWNVCSRPSPPSIPPRTIATWATKPNRRQFVDSFACFEHSPRPRRRHPRRMLQILASDCGFGPTMPCAMCTASLPCRSARRRYLVVLAKNCSNHHLVGKLDDSGDGSAGQLLQRAAQALCGVC